MVDFPSIVGTPDLAHSDLNGDGPGDDIVLTVDGETRLIGQGVIESGSRYAEPIRERAWYHSLEYKFLVLAAVTAHTKSSNVSVQLVTGLPVSYYQDAEALRASLLGTYTVTRLGRPAQRITVDYVHITRQGVGAILDAAFAGNLKGIYAQDTVGVIEIGSRTTNIAKTRKLRVQEPASTTRELGVWNVVTQLRSWIADHYPDITLHDHQIVDVVRTGVLPYYGDDVPVHDIIGPELELLAANIINAAKGLWEQTGGLGSLRRVLLAGGTSILLKDHLVEAFPQAVPANDPVMANIKGYWALGQYKAEQIAKAVRK